MPRAYREIGESVNIATPQGGLHFDPRQEAWCRVLYKTIAQCVKKRRKEEAQLTGEEKARHKARCLKECEVCSINVTYGRYPELCEDIAQRIEKNPLGKRTGRGKKRHNGKTVPITLLGKGRVDATVGEYLEEMTQK